MGPTLIEPVPALTLPLGVVSLMSELAMLPNT
jgi:hypothetical protein